MARELADLVQCVLERGTRLNVKMDVAEELSHTVMAIAFISHRNHPLKTRADVERAANSDRDLLDNKGEIKQDLLAPRFHPPVENDVGKAHPKQHTEYRTTK